MKYTGAKCSACGEVFTDTDDVVVCPECGTPHHRKCYRANGECVNTVRHSESFRWTDDRITENTVNTSPEVETSAENESGQVAGNTEKVRIEFQSVDDFINENIRQLDRNTKDGCSLREILDFVNKNVLYYMSVFTRIRNAGRNVSFNLPCFICPQLQFAYRKMWFWAVLTSILSILFMIPMMISLMVSNPDMMPSKIVEAVNNNAGILNRLMQLCSSADLIMRILFCLFGNRLYYNFTVKSIRRMKKRCGDNITKEQLISAGGTRYINVILIMLVTFALNFCAMSLIEFILPVIF